MGGGLRCDVEGCAAAYVSYSLARLTRAQAARIGWVRLRGGKIGESYSRRRKYDLCPEHVPATKAT